MDGKNKSRGQSGNGSFGARVEGLQKQPDQGEHQGRELEWKLQPRDGIDVYLQMGYDDLGRHYHETGDLVDASKAYSKERDYCQTSIHITIMLNRLLSVYVDQESWLSVEATVQKLRNLNQRPEDQQTPKPAAAMGLAHLETGVYGAAANTFVECDASILHSKTEGSATDESFNEFLTPNDVATYGALCALASMERNELQLRVLDNSNFRNYLELEPQLRRAISSFVGGKYSACLGIIESYRADYLLDPHLARHYPELLSRIRSKAIVQYFEPFSCVTFSALAAAFNSDLDTVMQSLVELIRAGSLNARLDFERDLLVACKDDARATAHEQGLVTAKNYERTLLQRVQRIEGIGANLEIKLTKSQSAFGIQGGDTLMGMDPALKGKAPRSGRGYFA